MLFTSVTGHLTEQDFTDEYRSWDGTNPRVLFEAPIVKYVPDKLAHIKMNLQTEAKNVSHHFMLEVDMSNRCLHSYYGSIATARVKIYRSRCWT
jgi:hypothetical protein